MKLEWNLNETIRKLPTILRLDCVKSYFTYRSFYSPNQRPKQGIIRSRRNSKIQQLKEQIKLLRRTNNNHQEDTKEIKTSNTCANSKNEFPGCVSHGGQKENIEQINFMNPVEQTMTSNKL